MRFAGAIRVQKHREEIIADLDTLAEDMLRAFFKVRFHKQRGTVQNGLEPFGTA